MSADTEHWTELKEFAHCQPCALAFRALVALLDTWPSDDQSAAIEYADKLLSAWPDATRLALWSWCKAASKCIVQPTWSLVRSLQLQSGHLSKGMVNLAQLAHHASLERITELEIPTYSNFQELSFLYHRPAAFPALKKLSAVDRLDDGDVRALADSPLWRTLESFEINDLTDSLVHRDDASRIVPRLERRSHVQHLTLRSPDLIAVWDASSSTKLRSASVIIRSVREAQALARRAELSRLSSLSIAFRCGFSGSSPFEPFLGNVIEADEAAADAFFKIANLDKLEKLAIVGYSMGYWGREGMGRHGLDSLIASGLVNRLKHLRLQLLPLGDNGVAALSPALGEKLETLELIDVYCKGEGAAALIDSHCMSSLRRLDLSGNRIDAEHFVQLSHVEMPNLHFLDFSGPPINPYYWNVGQQPLLDAGASAWARSANAKKLKTLRLQNCHLTDEALAEIFQSRKLRNLEELALSHNSFTAAAIATAVVGSLLWQRLTELELNHCRLDNSAIEALTQVRQAPALRSLQLGYNSIGPKGAAALAKWPVLSRVWRLQLHDNLIGDAGLIALAKSPNLSRILELDLEQDCWNSRAFTFSDEAAAALARSRALPRLDSLFSGCVDEYHGAAYSPGFTKDGLNAVRKSRHLRPVCRAACSDFSGIGEYLESRAFNEQAELADHDFRKHPMTLNEKEAQINKRSMQQVSLPRSAKDKDKNKPPKICASLPELDFSDEDIIEGLEFVEPTPPTDVSLDLNLSLEDDARPLPNQAGKFLSDTLDSIFKAASLGHFQTGGSGSRQGDDGHYIPTDVNFYVGVTGDPQGAIELIREALWWIGAPGVTDLDEHRLALTRKPAKTESRFLQLATLKIERWKMSGESGHRIDRVLLTRAQRKAIKQILAEAGAEAARGWTEIVTSDGGRMKLYTKYLSDSADYDTLNILVEALTQESSGLVHGLMEKCELMLLPMAFAPSAKVAETIDSDWPEVKVVTSAAALHDLLVRGPYAWWKHK